MGAGLVAASAAGLPALAARSEVEAPRIESARATRDEAHGLVPADADVRALFGHVREGTQLEGSVRIEAIHGLRAGAVPVVMATADGLRYAVEIFRADADGPRPLAETGSLALLLSNRGDGRAATPETIARGVQALARALDARCADGAPLPAGLATHRERRRAHPTGVFHVPV